MLFDLGAQKYNQNNLAILLNKLVFGFGPGSGLCFRVRAYIFGFEPGLGLN